MARPKVENRAALKQFRLTVKIPHDLEARVKFVANKRYEGNFSALVRVAVTEFLDRELDAQVKLEAKE